MDMQREDANEKPVLFIFEQYILHILRCAWYMYRQNSCNKWVL